MTTAVALLNIPRGKWALLRLHIFHYESAACQNLRMKMWTEGSQCSMERLPRNDLRYYNTLPWSLGLHPDNSVVVNLDDTGYNGSAVAALLTQMLFHPPFRWHASYILFFVLTRPQTFRFLTHCGAEGRTCHISSGFTYKISLSKWVD